MVGRMQMKQLQSALETVVKENIEENFIETGVWRGESCIFMRDFFQAYGITNQKIWVADSFEGLPRPNVKKYPQDAEDNLYMFDYLRVSLEQVRENFKKYDLLDEQVQFLKG